MSDRQTAIGVLEGIEERQGGWHRFSISMPGKQYPLKLDTKQEEVITAARAVMGKLATWSYTEKDAEKINPHTNQPYKNRYLEDVVPGASEEAQSASQATSAAATAGGKGEDVDWDAKECRDFRSRAWGQVLGATEHLISKEDLEKPGELFMRLHPLQRLIYHDIVRDLDSGEGVDDSDIPF